MPVHDRQASDRFGLDRQPETQQEDKYRSVASIPAKDVVPMYVASLFFGAFRAIVVDALSLTTDGSAVA